MFGGHSTAINNVSYKGVPRTHKNSTRRCVLRCGVWCCEEPASTVRAFSLNTNKFLYNSMCATPCHLLSSKIKPSRLYIKKERRRRRKKEAEYKGDERKIFSPRYKLVSFVRFFTHTQPKYVMCIHFHVNAWCISISEGVLELSRCEGVYTRRWMSNALLTIYVRFLKVTYYGLCMCKTISSKTWVRALWIWAQPSATSKKKDTLLKQSTKNCNKFLFLQKRKNINIHTKASRKYAIAFVHILRIQLHCHVFRIIFLHMRVYVIHICEEGFVRWEYETTQNLGWRVSECICFVLLAWARSSRKRMHKNELNKSKRIRCWMRRWLLPHLCN